MSAETDTLLYAVIGLFSFMIIMFVPLMVWIKLGGHPEGTYRILRIKYFSPIFIDAGRTPRRFILKFSKLTTGAPTLPAYFKIEGFSNALGRYYTDMNNSTNHNGRPSWYYHPDNPFPIPMLTLKQEAIISAQELEKAFNDDTVLDFMKVGKERKKSQGSNRLLLAGVVILVVISLIYLASLVRPH
jgi:hypothetical protein